MLKLFTGLLVLSTVTFVGKAQEASPRPHFVRATGEAVISAKPDRAEVTIGLSTHALTAQAASVQNAERSSQLINAIKHAMGAGGQVKTSGYSLAPQYEYMNGRPQRLTGYDANNSVNVTVDDLALLAKVIDSATSTGATNVNSIAFTLRDSSAVQQQALTQAAVKARANAEMLANALGVRVIALLEAQPGDMPIVNPPGVIGARLMSAQSLATPVEAGSLEIRATVTVTLEVR